MTWTPMTLLSAQMGQFNHPFWWLFMPITPFLYLVKNARVILHLFRKSWRIVVLVIKSLIPSSLLLILMFLMFFLNRYSWATILFLLFSGLFSVFFFSVISFSGIKNWIRWFKWERRQHAIIPGIEFLDLIDRFKTDSIRFKFINTVREKGLLEVTKENEALIESLACAIEQHNKTRQIAIKQKIKKKDRTKSEFDLEDKLLKTLPKSEEFAIWYKEYIDKNRTESGKFIYKLSRSRDLLLSDNIILDEIYMLLEQIRIRRRD
jgi:hypothetical protein